MQLYTHQNIDYYLATELKGVSKIEELGVDFVAKDIMDYVFKTREGFKEFIELAGQSRGNQKIAIFEAHGDNKRGWIYFDNGKQHQVQEWINKHDSDYGAIVFICCNPKTYVPKSEKSILVVPDTTVDLNKVLQEIDTSFTLYDPQLGEIDLYTIEWALKKLNS